ncbi:MAG: tetratricopeptide repeat protein [Deltaproteobacteria bacterium]
MVNRRRIIAGVLGAAAGGTLVTFAVAILIRSRGEAIRISPRPARRPAAKAAEATGPLADPQLRLPAPRERADMDAGVVDAARQFAIRLVTPALLSPESAECPEGAIRIERLALLNQTTDGRIEHWIADGAVNSRNEYGVVVRSRWRVVLGRADDTFFPVMAALEGFEIFRTRGHVEMLAEAREAAREQRQRTAAEQKAKELSANRAVWKAIDEAKPAEEKAAAALKLAVSLLDAGRKEPARRRLREVIDRFPDTRAAAEAGELLQQSED